MKINYILYIFLFFGNIFTKKLTIKNFGDYLTFTISLKETYFGSLPIHHKFILSLVSFTLIYSLSKINDKKFLYFTNKKIGFALLTTIFFCYMYYLNDTYFHNYFLKRYCVTLIFFSIKWSTPLISIFIKNGYMWKYSLRNLFFDLLNKDIKEIPFINPNGEDGYDTDDSYNDLHFYEDIQNFNFLPDLKYFNQESLLNHFNYSENYDCQSTILEYDTKDDWGDIEYRYSLSGPVKVEEEFRASLKHLFTSGELGGKQWKLTKTTENSNYKELICWTIFEKKSFLSSSLLYTCSRKKNKNNNLIFYRGQYIYDSKIVYPSLPSLQSIKSLFYKG